MKRTLNFFLHTSKNSSVIARTRSNLHYGRVFSGSVILIVLLGIGSCFNPPEFSEIPLIVRVEGVRTFEVPGASTPDSMIVSVHFRDGNGDIGIDATQNDPPYNERWFFLKTPITKCENGLFSPCNRISYIQDPTKLAA